MNPFFIKDNSNVFHIYVINFLYSLNLLIKLINSLESEGSRIVINYLFKNTWLRLHLF